MSISKESIEIIFGRAKFHLKPYADCFTLSGLQVPTDIAITLTLCEHLLTGKDEYPEVTEAMMHSAVYYIRKCERKYLYWLTGGAMSFYPFTGMAFGGDDIVTSRLDLSIGLN